MTVRVLAAYPAETIPAFDVIVSGALDWTAGNDTAAVGLQLLGGASESLHVHIDLGAVTDVDLCGLRSVQSVAASVVARGGTASLRQTSTAIFRLLEHIDWNGDWLDQTADPQPIETSSPVHNAR